MLRWIVMILLFGGAVSGWSWLTQGQDQEAKKAKSSLEGKAIPEHFFAPILQEDTAPVVLSMDNAFSKAYRPNGSKGQTISHPSAQEINHRYGHFSSYRMAKDLPSSHTHIPKPQTGFDMHQASAPLDVRYLLTMNRFIPAILYTAIDSEQASDKVIAKVEQDVFGFHGQEILIPQGSEVIGRYQPLSNRFHSRLMIEWYRLITPEGRHVRLNASTQTIQGQEGVSGQLDQKLLDRYQDAALFATLNIAAQFTNPIDDRFVSATQPLAYQMATLSKEALSQGLSIKPSLQIPKGTRLMISPMVDIWFHPTPTGWVLTKKEDK